MTPPMLHQASRSAGSRLFLGIAAVVASACGGATPLLHPAHSLEPGAVSFAAGTSATALGGDARRSLDRARAVTSSGSAVTGEEQATLAEGALAASLSTPGLAPFIAGRAGVAEHTEAGATYTGRWARLDLRRAFERQSFALSLGLGVSVLLPHPSADRREPQGTEGTIAGLDVSGATGFGIDAPILLGYRSETGRLALWGGPRAGYEQAFGTAVLGSDWPRTDETAPAPEGENPPPYEARFDGQRLWGAAVLGAGLRIVAPLYAGLEVSARYFLLSGTLRRRDIRAHGRLDGVTIEPAAALYAHF